MCWTFDPLEAKNAYLNLEKLGALAGEYVWDMYGRTDSPLHRGIGTARFVPTWAMDSTRVIERIVEGRAGPDPGGDRAALATFAVQRERGLDLPGEPDHQIDADRLLVPIPDLIQALTDASLEAAVRWRTAHAFGPVDVSGTGVRSSRVLRTRRVRPVLTGFRRILSGVRGCRITACFTFSPAFQERLT